MANVYIFDLITSEYLRTERCQLDPRGTQPLVPINGTLSEPPAVVTGQVAVLKADYTTWEIKDDHRGELQVEVATKIVSIVNHIGEVRPGYQLVSKNMADEILEHPEYYEVVAGELSRRKTSDIQELEVESLKMHKLQERATMFSDVEWRVSRHSDEHVLVLPPTDNIDLLAEYRQYLRDFTESDHWWYSDILTYDEYIRLLEGAL